MLQATLNSSDISHLNVSMRGVSALRHENSSRFREAALHFPYFLQARIR
jgi:hypothetical protein